MELESSAEDGNAAGWRCDGRRLERPTEGEFGVAAKQQAVVDGDAGGRVTAGGVDRVEVDQIGLGGLGAGEGPATRESRWRVAWL